MHCFKTRVYAAILNRFIFVFKTCWTFENRQDASDESAHDTFKKAIFSSEQFMIKNKFLQEVAWIMGLLAVCKIYFEHEVYLSLNS